MQYGKIKLVGLLLSTLAAGTVLAEEGPSENPREMTAEERRAAHQQRRAEMANMSDEERAAAREQHRLKKEERRAAARERWESMSEDDRKAMREQRQQKGHKPHHGREQRNSPDN